jgi:hypothetical protein
MRELSPLTADRWDEAAEAARNRIIPDFEQTDIYHGPISGFSVGPRSYVGQRPQRVTIGADLLSKIQLTLSRRVAGTFRGLLSCLTPIPILAEELTYLTSIVLLDRIR